MSLRAISPPAPATTSSTSRTRETDCTPPDCTASAMKPTSPSPSPRWTPVYAGGERTFVQRKTCLLTWRNLAFASRKHMTSGGLMAVPSPGYSITLRVDTKPSSEATAQLSRVVASAGGALTALDVSESAHDRLVIDLSCDAIDVAHAERITDAIRALEGF